MSTDDPCSNRGINATPIEFPQTIHFAIVASTQVFISHQWLGWGEPDPNGIHIAAMKQAVRAVAADAGVAPEKIRVWVDIASIPQQNKSEQRIAIASLPMFASSCEYFVSTGR